jgi:integrase
MSETITHAAIVATKRRAAVNKQRFKLKDRRLDGLYLDITPAGDVAWRGNIRCGARVRTFTLGKYPALGLSEARDAWRRLAHAVRYDGADPIQAKRDEARKAAPMTLAALLDLYGQQGDLKPSWATQLDPAIRNRCFKPYLTTPLLQLSLERLQGAIDAWPAARSAAFSAAALSIVLTWAAKPSRKLVDPVLLEMDFKRKSQPRDRWLDRQELAALLPVLRRARENGDHHAAGLEMQLLTGMRVSEVTTARWSWVDWVDRTLTLPRTKAGRKHVIRLSTAAMALLQGIRPADWKPGGLVLPGPRGKPLTAWEIAVRRFQQASGTENWTSHVLRHSVTTWLQQLGVEEIIIKVALNHSETPLSGATGNYGHHRYPEEARDALERLAALFDRIAAGEATAVVHLRSAEVA